MKKSLLLFVIFSIFISHQIFSQSNILNNIIDLDVSLKELSQTTPKKLDQIIKSNKYIIVEGSVSSITEIERSEKSLILDIHLVNGEWIGLDQVEVYKCIINVSGIKWESRFPKRRPREITSGLILQNNQILIIGKVTDYIMEDSKLEAIIEAEFIRKIQ